MPRVSSDRVSRKNRLQNLRSFCHAAEQGSISRAAELDGLSQPTVSLQIQALEDELQTALFQRRGPRISLTPDGQALLELARPLVEAFDALPHAFHASRNGLPTGRLGLAAGESTILHILPEALRAFSSAHPGIEIKLHNVRDRDGLRLLRNNVVDLLIGSLIEVPGDVEYYPTFTYPPVLITPLGHPLTRCDPVTIEDVARYPLILPPRNLTTWRVVDYVFHVHGLSYQVALEAGGWEVIKRYVEAGLGVSIVTGHCLHGREALETFPFDRYFPSRTYGVVVRKGKLLSRSARQFLEIIQAQGSPGRGGRSGKTPSTTP